MGNTAPNMTPELESAMEKYSLSESTITILNKKFKELDTMCVGYLDKTDFYAAVGMKPNYFANKIFEIVDLDGDDEISFYEFVCCTCSYCSLTHSQVLRFCFDIFDKDDSGYLDEVDFLLILHSSSYCCFFLNRSLFYDLSIYCCFVCL